MAARKRKAVEKKLPVFRVTKEGQAPQAEDLKQEKARTTKDLEESEKEKREWLDNELDKNLKSSR